MANPQARKVAFICSGLRRTGDREVLADALTQVAAVPCSPEGLQLRSRIFELRGLELIQSALLTAHGDVRLQCKAANALGSMLMSECVAKGFWSTPNCSAVLNRLGDMMRSKSQWAQADAAGCLGWLVGHVGSPAVHELIPLAAQLLLRHTMTDDNQFIQEETKREEKARRDRNRDRFGRRGHNAGERGGWDSGCQQHQQQQPIVTTTRSLRDDDGSKEEVARERMDNIRVYSLIFLVKASHADSSVVAPMVQTGVIAGLLRYLTVVLFAPSPPKGPLRGEGIAPRYRDQDVGSETAVEESPSLFLAARLLYAFSLDRIGRASLLQAKCLPPLIRILQRLEENGKDRKAITFTTGSEMGRSHVENERARNPLLSFDAEGEASSVSSGNKSLTQEGTGGPAGDAIQLAGRGDPAISCDGPSHARGNERNKQPQLEEMIGLIIDQVLGRTCSSTSVQISSADGLMPST